jgi:ferredoxin-type protein NapH
MYWPYRRASQIVVFLAMFLIPLLNLYEIYAVTGTFYAINIGGLGIADPVVILQAIFASGQLTVPLLSAALLPIMAALLFGRIWCGWMCPYHLLSDAAAWLRSKIARKRVNRTRADSSPIAESFKANIGRFGFLVFGTAVAGMIGIPVLNYLSAPGILSTEAMILVKERTVSLEFGFIALLLIIELLLLPRFWCRLFCPTGAFIALFRTPFTLRVGTKIKTPRAACCKNGSCSSVCPMGLAPYRQGGNLLCTNCGKCIDACRREGGPGSLRFTGFSERDDRTM